MSITNQRYNRQIILPGFGAEAQQKLQQAKVLVIGAGGLGVPVLQYLTGMGVGTIGIMDGDVVSLTNLHRQVLYNETDININKAIAATRKLEALNSSVLFQTISKNLTTENALATIEQYNLIIDATDNFASRYLINDACIILKKPFVYGAVHQYEGQVSVFNFEGGPTYRCLYPQMPSANEIPDCNTGGVLGVAPGIVGCHMALEAIKIITGIGKNLSGQLQVLDMLNNSQYTLQLKANPNNQNIKSLQESHELQACSTIPNLEIKELLHWIETGKTFTLLDLRDEEDYELSHIQNAQFFSTQVVKNGSNDVGMHAPVAAICYRGHRSLQAAVFLKEKYPQLEIYNVVAGMDGWAVQADNKFVIHE